MSRELFAVWLKSSRASSLLQVGGDRRPAAKPGRTCPIATNWTDHTPASVGASLSRELFAVWLKSSRASSLLQVGGDRRPAAKPGRTCPTATSWTDHTPASVGASLSRELFAVWLKSSRASSLLQVGGDRGPAAKPGRTCPIATSWTDHTPTSVGASLSRELFAVWLKSSLLQVGGDRRPAAKPGRTCPTSTSWTDHTPAL